MIWKFARAFCLTNLFLFSGAVIAGMEEKTSINIVQQAQIKTITLNIPGMKCKVCPITVRKALEKIDGVSKVSINFDAKTATVIFDPKKATSTSIAHSVGKAGYPSTILK